MIFVFLFLFAWAIVIICLCQSISWEYKTDLESIRNDRRKRSTQLQEEHEYFVKKNGRL